MTANLFDVLSERGMVAQVTDPSLRERLGRPLAAYMGFDPTAAGLGVGNLVAAMMLYWLQQCGHKPIVIMGGGTGLVGDPSGKTESRKMLTRDEVAANIEAQAGEFKRILRFDDSPTGAKLLDNADWLAGVNWIDMLREVGACFSVSRMLTMDSVRTRLETGGITFLEFNYMVMQAYDFLHLYRTQHCELQMGGQDQWGNIVMGVELIRRLADAQAFGLTTPLLLKADGTKFGKSEKGNVWLSDSYTPVYDFYQFWRNTADSEVKKCLGFFTTLSVDEIGRLTDKGGDALNGAKEALAFDVTRRIHGEAAAEKAREDARRAFGKTQDVTGDTIPHGDLSAAELEAGAGLLALLVRAGLASSNSDARRLVQGGGVRVHDRLVGDPNEKVTTSDVNRGHVLLRVGKKKMYRFDVRQ
jgi:tyrosyl-tRNA synthetase